jgi:protein-S-isoprenylcysteine O-methyltransferase Ste14
LDSFQQETITHQAGSVVRVQNEPSSLSPYAGEVSAPNTYIPIVWALFWVYWLVAATGAKGGSRTIRSRPPGLLIAVVAFVLLRAFRGDILAVHSPIVQGLGAILFICGLGLAVWARVYLGRNWGMPMTQKDEPELVTSGPYRFVRHPIYFGILLAVLGTSLATEVYWLIVAGIMGAYFVHSARVEEKLMTASFPATYPSYRAKTKMLIPFVL